MRTILEPAQDGVIAPTRIFLLPAAYTAPEHFVREGFVRAAREREVDLDLVLVDLELQYLADGSVMTRLREELVLPARTLGCAVWICGVSLGGFVGIGYAARHPLEIDGLCLLAPYLGSRIIAREIEGARGLASWPAGEMADDDEERRTWSFIKDHRALQRPLHLGFGRDDRFAGSHRLLAADLPAEDVDVVTGGHDWPTWLQLWQNFLDDRFSPAGRRTHERRAP